MMNFVREFRLVPIVAFAAASLLVLKTVGLLFDGGYTLSQRPAMAEAPSEPALIGRTAKPDVARPMPVVANPGSRRPSEPISSRVLPDTLGAPEFTGSTMAPKSTEPPTAPGEPGPPAVEGAPPPPIAPDHPMTSAGERAVLESLNQRRLELDARARELDVRESLLTAAEKRIEGRLVELKEIEARITAATQKKDEAEAARFKGLVTMYENMKAKDAAKIFDRLDLQVLVAVATQINPRRMSDILAQMTPEAAERLTLEIANRSGSREAAEAPPPSELPKIEGRPNGT